MSINLSRISNSSVTGRLLRAPLRLVPRGLVLPIVQGPLAGRRWIVGASTHGCWLGTYEFSKQRTFAAAAVEARVVFDIGANVGFYTLLSAVASPSSHVFAFEPLPRNLEFLEAHVRLNLLAGKISVIAAAVGDVDGYVRFDDRAGPSMGSVAPSGNHEVRAVTLDGLYAAGRIPDPQLVKIDVEGAEASVLAGGRQLFLRARPTIFLSTHGHDLHRRCSQLLGAFGYTVHDVEPGELIARP